MKKKSARSIENTKADVEAMKCAFEGSVWYSSNRLSGGKISPLYDADDIQEGWWLIFDCPQAFSLDWEELHSMELFWLHRENQCEGLRGVKSWVYFDGTSCSIWFAIYLDR